MLLLAFAPSLLKLRTIPAPMPRAPPVTIATLPCNDIIVSIEWQFVTWCGYFVSVPLLFIYPSDVTEWISPSRSCRRRGYLRALLGRWSEGDSGLKNEIK